MLTTTRKVVLNNEHIYSPCDVENDQYVNAGIWKKASQASTFNPFPVPLVLD
jgi:hypothetical protein